jgi:hypothetical protein
MTETKMKLTKFQKLLLMYEKWLKQNSWWYCVRNK